MNQGDEQDNELVSNQELADAVAAFGWVEEWNDGELVRRTPTGGSDPNEYQELLAVFGGPDTDISEEEGSSLVKHILTLLRAARGWLDVGRRPGGGQAASGASTDEQ